MNARNGAPENQFGVRMGDIRTIARSIKGNHPLGLELWATGNVDAMFLATLVMKPKLLSGEDLERMAASVTYPHLADWLTSYIIKQHPDQESLRLRWMESTHPMLARAGWSLTDERINKNPDGLDLGGLLDRIEREMAGAPAPAQWTMNFCLAGIGIHFPEHRQRAIDIGERLGLYRDYPVSKGCTSPFAPIWIREMVSRHEWTSVAPSCLCGIRGAWELFGKRSASRCTPESAAGRKTLAGGVVRAIKSAQVSPKTIRPPFPGTVEGTSPRGIGAGARW